MQSQLTQGILLLGKQCYDQYIISGSGSADAKGIAGEVGNAPSKCDDTIEECHVMGDSLVER